MFDFKDKAAKAADVAKKFGQGGKAAAEKTAKMLKATGDKGVQAVSKSKNAVVNVIDQNGDGSIDSADLIIMALKVPGVRIERNAFLKKELFKYCSSEIIEKAIETTPAEAGIAPELVDKVADEVIKFERNAVTGISAALGMPGGVAMAATIPADIAQYYGYMIRAAQKLLYLYGFPELDIEEDIELDSETLNSLTICLGVMYGVANANHAIQAIAKALATGVEKQLLKKALTKGTIYPIVKAIARWFGKRMTKEIFAGFFKKAIPIAGGVVGGGLTYVTFKPCCYKLKDALKDTILSNPNHKESDMEEKIYENIKNDVIDIDLKDVVIVEDIETEEEDLTDDE